MSTQKNKRYQFPHSLLAHLKTALGDRFTVLPKRVQKGYTTLLWNNQYITKANRHTKDSASWKTSAKTLKLLFGDPQIFRDVNTNGFYMNPNRSSLKGKYKICREDDQDATYYPPTEWVKVTFTGYAATNGRKGVISGYQTSPEILKILEDWSEKAVLDESQPSGFDINIKDIETLAKKDNPLENIDTLVRINMMSLFEYRFQLELIQEHLEGLNLKVLHYGTEEWHECKAHIEGTEGERKGGRGEETDWGIVDLKQSLKPLQTLFLKDLTLNNNSQQLIQIKKIFTMLRELNFEGIPVTYELRSTGRYFATNATLQGYSKEVRYAALHSCYEYDLESAHQSILLQLLDQKSIDFPELEKLREYVDHKQVIREKLSEELQLPLDIIKNILQALTYGARLSRSPEEAIYRECDGDKEAIERVVKHPWLAQYLKVFEKAHQHLIGDKKNFKNALGIVCEKTGISQQMAHLLQGHERQVIDSLIKRSKKGDIALLLHDAIVFNGKTSPTDLSAFVKRDTGFDLVFSEEAY